jgi:hypothetical protein
MCFHTLRITSVARPEKVGWRGASLSPPVRQATLSQCETFTDTVQLNASLMQLTKAEQKEAKTKPGFRGNFVTLKATFLDANMK